MSLQAGDSIEISVSHQVYIDGDQSWVKFGAASKVFDSETPEEAVDRLSEFVNRKVIDVIKQTVKTVKENA